MKLLKFILLPISAIYGCILWLRNVLYNAGILKESEVGIKTIVVGNLALGGTGKTPHIEWLIRSLSEKKIAVLTRGYGRSTTETLFAKPEHTADQIGDEPLQLIRKFPDLTLCVQADRLKGVEAIKSYKPEIELIILDDAFQHRKLKAGFNILLTTYQKPFTQDFYVPSGTLRDHKIRAKDADLIIVSKTPEDSSLKSREKISKQLSYLGKPIFYSSLKYGDYVGLNVNDLIGNFENYFLLTGIANPELFKEKVESEFKIEKHLKFEDHHKFTRKNLESFRDIIGNFAADNTAFITTEKDAMRLLPYQENLNDLGLNLFYLPIEIKVTEDKSQLDQILHNYSDGARE